MAKNRLDQELAARGLVSTRSQAESYIRLGQVKVDGKVIAKPGYFVGSGAKIRLEAEEQYVSRAALKLASVAKLLMLDFRNKVVLDVGSSTGGFTDYALRNGAKKVIAVELGADQLHPNLKSNPKIELHEKTDIRNFTPAEHIDVVVGDVSFISLREILPHIAKITDTSTQIVVMAKPQFEARESGLSHKGVVKNDRVRRQILQDFEQWCKQNNFMIQKKSDSAVAGEKGNLERFYLLRKVMAK